MPRFLPCATLALLAPACVVGPRGRVAVVAPLPVVSIRYVDREPPPLRYEPVPPPPAPDHVWVAGYWAWEARGYVWVPGRYHLRPHPRAAWENGHWERHRDHGWYWVEGRWR